MVLLFINVHDMSYRSRNCAILHRITELKEHVSRSPFQHDEKKTNMGVLKIGQILLAIQPSLSLTFLGSQPIIQLGFVPSAVTENIS